MKQLFGLLLFISSACMAQNTTIVNFNSAILDQTRKLWIDVPQEYKAISDSCHLILLLDADNVSLFNYTVAAKRFLESNAVDLSDFKTPKSIVVGIEQKDRSDDFVENAADFLFFLTKEVLPYIKANYRTKNYTILIGHSLGGRFALYALLKEPAIFNAIITASPAFEKDEGTNIITQIDSLIHSGLRYDRAVYLSTTYLKNDRTEEQFRDFAEAANLRFSKSSFKNFRFLFGSSNTLGHAKSPFFSIPDGLHFIYDPKLWQTDADRRFGVTTSGSKF
jgi:predicted alpha/beta superfamily hydrolase